MTTLTDIMTSIRRATEARDAEALSSLYADDARLTIVDRSSPPSKPARVEGRDAIAEYLRARAAVDMTHRVEAGTGDEHSLAYRVDCRYPDGKRVLYLTMADLDREGRIADQTVVQAWDE
jgi:ketosteroid isomerase-like protein